MKVSNVNPPGWRAAVIVRGLASSQRAGSSGITVADDNGNEVSPAVELQLIGASVADAGDGVAIVNIDGPSSWFNVRAYGALGDGDTDDAQAFDDAIAALNDAGTGVLYVPASAASYVVSRALDSITVPCTLMGDGQESLTSPSGPVSLIECTSATAQLFTFTAAPVTVQKISMRNTSAGASAGGALSITNGTSCLLDGVQLRGFYTGVDVQLGARWMMSNCSIYHFNKYGVRIRNATDPDDGDWAIANCQIISTSATGTADACVRIESAGGGKIVNTKLGGVDATRGIDVVVGTGIDTSILLVANVSIENVAGDGLHLETTGSGSYEMLQVTNCQFGLYSNTTGKAINVTAASLGQIAHVVVDDLVCVSTGGNTNAAVALTNVDSAVIGTVIQEGFGSRLSTSGCTSIWDNTKPFSNYPLAVIPQGVSISDNATAGTSITNNAAQRASGVPVIVPGPMFVRSLWIHVTSNGSGSIQWGLFDYITSRTSATKLAGGSAAPGGTGWREIAASGAPVLVPPGQYMLIVFNPASNQSTISVSTTTGAAAAGFWKGVVGYTWDDTPDLTSGFSDSSICYQCYIEGDMDRAGNRW